MEKIKSLVDFILFILIKNLGRFMQRVKIAVVLVKVDFHIYFAETRRTNFLIQTQKSKKNKLFKHFSLNSYIVRKTRNQTIAVATGFSFLVF